MKHSKSKGFHQPFKNLSTQLKPEKKEIKEPAPHRKAEVKTRPTVPEDDHTLFLKAMADVTPISRKNIADIDPLLPKIGGLSPSDEYEVVHKLKDLVNHGDGYVVSSTPEYMEGTGYDVHPEISKRLHKGRFSIQAHLDLHGMTVAEAQPAFDAFIKDSINRGYRGLLVIHGRGLSSPDKPVLKPKVFEWLTQGQWRKWVIAFSSAKPADGGAGATYILLRKNPVTKKYRKKSSTG